MKNVSFIAADNDIIINEATIRWVKKMNECLEVCSKHGGCYIGRETIRICKINNPQSYEKLEKYFVAK